MRLLLLGLAGAMGRYGLGVAIGTGPASTLAINVFGSLLLGVLLAAVPVPRDVQIVLATGLLAAFTTF